MLREISPSNKTVLAGRVPEISHRAFDLGVTKQKLDSPEIPRAPVDEGSQFDCRHQIIQRPSGSRIALGAVENVDSVTLRSPLINQSVHMIRYAKARPARLVI
jgi:hypothetical protein